MSETAYSARLELPYTFERGRNTVARCPVHHAGTVVEPVSGTFSLRDPTGTVVLTGASSNEDGVPTFTVTTAVLAAYPYGEGWQVEWVLVMPDGVAHTFRCGAQIVRIAWHPVVTDQDLYRKVSALTPGPSAITSLQTYQPYIDEAATDIQRLLIQAKRRPWLICDPTELRSPHVLLSLAITFEDLASRLNAAYLEQAKLYRAQFEAAWGRVQLSYDLGDDGMPDVRRAAKSPGFWMGRQ